MISAQHGTEFTSSHYERIKKVYSVWICIHPPKSRMNTLTSYSIEEHNHVGNAHEKRVNYDLLTVVMICLGDKSSVTKSDVISLLNLLFVSERTEKEKQQLLKSKFGMKMSNTFGKGVNSMCNYGEGIFAKGIREGRAEGRKEGRAEGRNAEKMETATNLRKLGVSVETISQATGLSPEQIAKL